MTRPLVLLAACVLLPATAVAAQDDTLRTASPLPAVEPPSTGGWGAVSVLPRPGTTVATVTVALPVGSASDPEGREGRSAHVFLAEGDVARRRSVVLGKRYGSRLRVARGLEGEEVLVVEGHHLLRDGAKITAVPSDADAPPLSQRERAP